jgi:uncharacterized membrane protein
MTVRGPTIARAPSAAPRRRMDGWISARKRLSVSFAAAVVVLGAVAWFSAWEVSVLLAWCGAATTFLGLAWGAVLKADSQRTRAIARRQDESRASLDLVVLTAAVISLIGVGFILLKANRATGVALALMTGLGVASIVLGWAVVHTTYTLRYADLYYEHDRGIDFNEEEPPDYRDFAYLAFTIGMTYQVSDTDLQTKSIRRTALKHALLSYLFGVAIIAVTINVVAGLAR